MTLARVLRMYVQMYEILERNKNTCVNGFLLINKPLAAACHKERTFGLLTAMMTMVMTRTKD